MYKYNHYSLLYTHSHVAHKLFVAYSLIRLVDRSRTSRSHAVAVTSIATTVVIATKFSYFQIAIVRATRTLKNVNKYLFTIIYRRTAENATVDWVEQLWVPVKGYRHSLPSIYKAVHREESISFEGNNTRLCSPLPIRNRTLPQVQRRRYHKSMFVVL